jgi:hypothetical protein
MTGLRWRMTPTHCACRACEHSLLMLWLVATSVDTESWRKADCGENITERKGKWSKGRLRCFIRRRTAAGLTASRSPL